MALAGCGTHAPGGAPAEAAADTGDTGATDGACALDPTGSFTFHVHNASASAIVIDLGCGRTLPIVLATPAGRLPIGPGAVDVCEFTCDQIYAGQASPGGCTDCGGGVSMTIVPAGMADIPWDRRVYARHALTPPCTSATKICAWGAAVAASTAQQGALTTCPADQHQTFSCAAPTSTSFTVDTAGADATITVGP